MPHAALWEAYENTRRRSADPATRDQTPAEWVRLVNEFRQCAADPTDLDATRGLGLALWRQGLALFSSGAPQAAVEPGEQALQVLGERLERLQGNTGSSPGSLDEAMADLLTASADHGEVVAAVSGYEAQVDLLTHATNRDQQDLGPRSRRALGTVYHNLSVAQLNAFVKAVEAGRLPFEPTVPAASASRAFEIRYESASVDELMTLWELANTQIHYARCLLLIGDKPRARKLIELAERGVAIDPDGLFADLRAQFTLVAQAVRSA